MKSPQFQVKEEGGATTAGMQRDYIENRYQENANTILTFKRDSPETEPIEIMNNLGGIIFRIDYVDSYNQPYHGGIKNHHMTYIEKDIKVIRNDVNKDTVKNDGSSAYQYSTKLATKMNSWHHERRGTVKRNWENNYLMVPITQQLLLAYINKMLPY